MTATPPADDTESTETLCECEMGWQCDFCRQHARGYNGNHTPADDTETQRVERLHRLADAIDQYDLRLWIGHADLESLVASLVRAARAAGDDPWTGCTGASDCPESWHEHGCYADTGQCSDPLEHAATTAVAGDDLAVERERIAQAIEASQVSLYDLSTHVGVHAALAEAARIARSIPTEGDGS